MEFMLTELLKNTERGKKEPSTAVQHEKREKVRGAGK